MTNVEDTNLPYLSLDQLRAAQLDRIEAGLQQLIPLLNLLTPPTNAEETNLIELLFQRLDALREGQMELQKAFANLVQQVLEILGEGADD